MPEQAEYQPRKGRGRGGKGKYAGRCSKQHGPRLKKRRVGEEVAAMMEDVSEAMITDDALMVVVGKGPHDRSATQCCMGA